MAQWANSNHAFSEPYAPSPPHPAAGTRLDQILADLKARPRPHMPDDEDGHHRNVTPLNTPFRSEFQSLHASIAQLADRMDSHRLTEAIAELSEKIANLNADRSLGEAELRLLRSIRRSLDDLIYHMNLTGTDAQAALAQPAPQRPLPAAPEAPPVFGRRGVVPSAPRPLPGQIAAPQLEPRHPIPHPIVRSWPGSQFISRHPLASVAAAAVLALMLAQSMTQFLPRISDITGSVRLTPRAPAPLERPDQTAAYAPAPAAAPAPAPVYVPTAPATASSLPISTPVPQAAPAIVTASRPADDVGGAAAYQAGVRLADGPARDIRGAIALFEKAGDMPAAQFRLALIYERGQGVPKNSTLARTLYQRAAEKGHVRAMHNLGVLYADGPDGKPDYALAAEWFRRAADYGLRDSQYNLATLTARGLGIEKKPIAAYSWYALAAAQGDAEAARQRDEIAKTLDAGSLRAAKAMTDGFRAKTPDPAVNLIATN